MATITRNELSMLMGETYKSAPNVTTRRNEKQVRLSRIENRILTAFKHLRGEATMRRICKQMELANSPWLRDKVNGLVTKGVLTLEVQPYRSNCNRHVYRLVQGV